MTPDRMALVLARQTRYNPAASLPLEQAPMTQLLEAAVSAARSLPPDVQDDIARIVLRLALDEEPTVMALTPDERDAIEVSLAQAANGEFATEAEVEAVWAKFGL